MEPWEISIFFGSVDRDLMRWPALGEQIKQSCSKLLIVAKWSFRTASLAGKFSRNRLKSRVMRFLGVSKVRWFFKSKTCRNVTLVFHNCENGTVVGTYSSTKSQSCSSHYAVAWQSHVLWRSVTCLQCWRTNASHWKYPNFEFLTYISLKFLFENATYSV